MASANRGGRHGPVVLDTSVLLRWTLRPDDLTDVARRAIARAQPREQLFVSAISVWEVALKARQGRLELGLPAPEFARRLDRVAGLQVLAVDVPTWLAAVALDWEHRDPANRVIVATAARRDALLVSSDAVIADYYDATLW